MLNHPTHDLLRQLKLDGMADAFTELQSQDSAADMGHAEWLGLLIDREVANRTTKRFQSRLAEIAGRLCEVGGFQRHVFADDHRHDLLTDAFDLGGGAFERVAIRRIDGDREVMVAKGDAPCFLIIGGLSKLFAQGDGGIVGSLHLADDPLDALGHDVVRDRAEGVRQHDVERQVERIEKRDIREGRIGFHRKERAVFDPACHGIGQGDHVAIKGRAAIAQTV
uniref:RC116 n=1 Tax=Ruegeria sp. PR1b TaxID=185588 RepID=Q8KW74_9RHOB|nr:RC116 [Ruegeria sp. PR1b]